MEQFNALFPSNQARPVMRPLITKPVAVVPAAVTNWTVQDAGSTKAPTSNDYGQWTIQQLRRECTARGKKIARSIDDEGGVRRAWLRENDEVRLNTGKGNVTSNVPRASRVVNVISPDRPVRKTPENSGNKAPSDIANTVGVKRPSQEKGRVEKEAFSQSGIFRPAFRTATALVPPKAVHVTPQPVEVTLKPVQVTQKPVQVTPKPAHMPFKPAEAQPISQPPKPVLYNPVETQPKPVQVPFKPVEIPQSAQPTTVPSLPVVASGKERDVPVILDCISKTYAIRTQIQRAMKDQDTSQHDPVCQQSIELLEAGLYTLEREFAVAMGLDYPPKKARI